MTNNDLQRLKNKLKQPQTTYNEQETTETTYNDMKRPIKNKKRPSNNLQLTRNNLKRPTTSKAQRTATQTYLQRAKKIHETKTKTTKKEQADFEIILQYGQLVFFSNTFSTEHLVAIIRALLHGESW